MLRHSTLVAALFCSTTLAGGVAHAQQARETPSARAIDSTVEELIVTAQRREENLVDVPLSISVATGEALEKANVTNIESLQQVVSGLTLTFSGANAQPTVRGVGSQVAGVGLFANVATYVDSFYRPNPVTNNLELVDIDSIQLLKGPQGTLYGRNATGGAILVTTRQPSFDASADLRLTYASYNEARADVFVTGPIISDKLAGSVAFFTRHSDNFNTNLVPNVSDDDRRTTTARVKLLYQPTDTIRLTLTAERTDIKDPNVFVFTTYKGFSAGVFVPGAIVSSKAHEYSNDYAPLFKDEVTGLFLKGEFDFPWARLTSLSAAEWERNYGRYDVDGSSIAISHADFPRKQDDFSQEFILSSRSKGPLTWLAGLYFLRDHGYQTLSVPTPAGLFQAVEGGITTKAWAAYVDGTYNFAERFYLTAGIRYSKDKLNEEFAPGIHNPKTKADVSFDKFTPRVSLRYELSDEQNVYASFNTGYKTGGFNVLSLSTNSVKPETINAYEVGYKLGKSGWNLNLAAFYYDYKNLQVIAFQTAVASLVNAAKSENYGAEAEFSGQITDRLSVNGGVSYLHARYKDFKNAPHYVWSPLTGVSVGADDASGNPVINAPEWTARLGATYIQPLPVGELEFSGNASYQSTVYYDAFKDTKQSGYALLNLRADWNAPDDKYSVGVFVQNVFDKNYIRAIVQQGVAFSSSYSPPRIVGVQLRIRR